MSLDPQRVRPADPVPRVLVVDDDRRVLELLEIALSANGFRVITAADGDEAIQRAASDRPDMIVLDVRLPRRSGFEVCEWLRRDPDEPHVPIILVSAATEPEARLQAFRRGADDYLSKPFSPKELVARVKRLLVRASEARASRERVRELERELSRTREEIRRAHGETRREQRIRELALGVGRDLQRSLDVDELARRLLAAATGRLGVGMAVLLLAEREGGPLVPVAVRGEGLERMHGIEVERGGALAQFLMARGRPVLRRDLERFAELRGEIAPFVSCGAAVLAPLSGPDGLIGLLAVDERRDGREPTAEEAVLMEALCDVAGTPVFNAQRIRFQLERMVDLLIESAPADGPQRAAVADVTELVQRAARVTLMPARLRALLAMAMRLDGYAPGSATRRSLESMSPHDTTGRICDLLRMITAGSQPEEGPDERRAALLLEMARVMIAARREGRSLAESLGRAVAEVGERLDASTRQALESARAEIEFTAPRAA